MNKKRLLLILCVFALALCSITFGQNIFSRKAHTTTLRPLSPPPANAVAPDHIVYAFLFSKVRHLSEKTRELRAKRVIGQKPYFPLQREAGLNEGRATALEAIAFACWQQVSQQDEKAKAIIKAFQSRFPDGKVPEGGSPPPPPELKAMWEERNAIILRARDQLRAVFGEEEFARFNNYAKFHYGANNFPATINPVSPQAKQK